MRMEEAREDFGKKQLTKATENRDLTAEYTVELGRTS